MAFYQEFDEEAISDGFMAHSRVFRVGFEFQVISESRAFVVHAEFI